MDSLAYMFHFLSQCENFAREEFNARLVTQINCKIIGLTFLRRNLYPNFVYQLSRGLTCNTKRDDHARVAMISKMEPKNQSSLLEELVIFALL